MRTTIKVRQLFRHIKNQMLLFENMFNDLELETNKEYSIEIKEIRDKRTLEQNKMMWALIREIANHEDVSQNEIDVYTTALEEANAKYDYLLGTKEVEENLRKNFRAVKVVRPTIEHGKEYIVYKCFSGSSKLNTKEMQKLIDILISWASELGIETSEEYYSKI